MLALINPIFSCFEHKLPRTPAIQSSSSRVSIACVMNFEKLNHGGKPANITHSPYSQIYVWFGDGGAVEIENKSFFQSGQNSRKSAGSRWLCVCVCGCAPKTSLQLLSFSSLQLYSLFSHVLVPSKLEGWVGKENIRLPRYRQGLVNLDKSNESPQNYAMSLHSTKECPSTWCLQAGKKIDRKTLYNCYFIKKNQAFVCILEFSAKNSNELKILVTLSNFPQIMILSYVATLLLVLLSESSQLLTKKKKLT